MSGILANRTAQQQLRDVDERRRLQVEADFKAIMSTPSGRRFTYALLNRANLFGNSFAGGSDAHTNYNEGRRSIAVDLVNEAQRLCPELWALAVQEAVEAERNHAALRRAAEAAAKTEESR